jgi:hypothetical protein
MVYQLISCSFVRFDVYPQSYERDLNQDRGVPIIFDDLEPFIGQLNLQVPASTKSSMLEIESKRLIGTSNKMISLSLSLSASHRDLCVRRKSERIIRITRQNVSQFVCKKIMTKP